MAGEQVAAGMANIGQQLVDIVHGIPMRLLQRVTYSVLVAWLALILLQFIGLLLPNSTDSDDAVTVSEIVVNNSSESQVDIERLMSFNLFGEIGAQSVVEEFSSVPLDEEVVSVKTTLSLILQGIISASDSSSAVAIIVHQGKQEQYYIGDKLPEGNNVTLANVLNDHVILNNQGQSESLWLYDDSDSELTVTELTSRPVRHSRATRIDKRNNVVATNLAQDYRTRLYKNPTSLAEVLRIAPAQQDGQMVGYRVSPGKDRAQFAALGFKTNDIVTSINNINLDEPSQALEVYKLMRTAKEANFTVLRNGRSVELMVALGEE